MREIDTEISMVLYMEFIKLFWQALRLKIFDKICNMLLHQLCKSMLTEFSSINN